MALTPQVLLTNLTARIETLERNLGHVAAETTALGAALAAVSIPVPTPVPIAAGGGLTAQIVAYGVRTAAGTPTTGASRAAAQKVMELDVNVLSGHLYRITTNSFNMMSTVARDIADVIITYTIDGSTPAPSGGTSTLLTEAFRSMPATGLAQPAAVIASGYYVATSNNVPLKVLLSYYRAFGTGAVSSVGNVASRALEMFIEDWSASA